MAYELQGRLFEIFDTQQITDTFKKREFVVETTSGMYNEYIKMQAVQDKCDLLDSMNKGDQVKVSFDLRGKLVNTKDGRQVYITNINAWRIDRQSGGSSAPPTPDYGQEPPAAGGDYEDVPF
ncbi:MAG: DUF3127 domain-containing protein [Candidatus Kapaibacteriota bacterium]